MAIIFNISVSRIMKMCEDKNKTSFEFKYSSVANEHALCILPLDSKGACKIHEATMLEGLEGLKKNT